MSYYENEKPRIFNLPGASAHWNRAVLPSGVVSCGDAIDSVGILWWIPAVVVRRYCPLLWWEFSIHPHTTRLSTFWDIHISRIGETWGIAFLAVGLQILLLQILWVLPSCESLSPHHWSIFSWPFYCSVQGWFLRGGVIEIWYLGNISQYTW